ncbi:MAG: hypothetical protein ACK4FB_10040 [Brevundimonas sp.]|uniref:hypothetical protein n=1 Tax=Brevundimonas sp. TaxID=1871086 RepID=UPI00391D22FE
MSRFVELTHENGTRLSVNVDLVVSFAPLGGDDLRGTVVSFGYSAGDKNMTRNVRVIDAYEHVAAKFANAR